jgi:hypothetical protein
MAEDHEMCSDFFIIGADETSPAKREPSVAELTAFTGARRG